jgi:solute carrier family 10 (sodium/bile acid cotransporter), member 7
MKRRVDWFLLGMVACVVLAWRFPGPGAHGGWLMPELLNKAGVALIFLLHGLALAPARLRAGALQWRLHTLVQLATFVLFPLLGMALVAVGPYDGALGLGILFLCALPSTVSSSVALTAVARGNVAGALFNATLSNSIGVLLTPLWRAFLVSGRSRALPLGPVIVDLACWLLLPLALGQLLRPWLGSWAARNKRWLSPIDRLTILLLVYTSFCDSMVAGVWSSHGVLALLQVGLACLLLLAAVMLIVALASRNCSPEDRSAALFCGSKKTLASGVPMARVIFGADPSLSLILLPLMLFHPLQLVVCSWLANRFAQRDQLRTKRNTMSSAYLRCLLRQLSASKSVSNSADNV